MIIYYASLPTPHIYTHSSQQEIDLLLYLRPIPDIPIYILTVTPDCNTVSPSYLPATKPTRVFRQALHAPHRATPNTGVHPLASTPVSTSVSTMHIARQVPALLLLLVATLATSTQAKKDPLNNGFTHRAHAVPGGPYRGLDLGAGSVPITLNGERSHSHYYNRRTNKSGRIVKFQWVANGKTICRSVRCTVPFRKGVTKVRLKVVDNTADTASAITKVTVVSGSKPALRAWFYPGNGRVGSPKQAGVPTFSKNSRVVAFTSKASFPTIVRKVKFSMRLVGAIEIPKPGKYSFRLGCLGGDCILWVNSKLLVKAKSKTKNSRALKLSTGTASVHVLYRRPLLTGNLKLTLQWKKPGSKSFTLVPAGVLTHQPSKLRPVINFIRPAKGPIGTFINIFGTSFLNVRVVRIGKANCNGPVAKNEFQIRCTLPGGSGVKPVAVVTPAGASNLVKVEIIPPKSKGSSKSGGKDPKPNGNVGYTQNVKFSQTFLKRGGNTWIASGLTSIAYGPDGRYYIGSLEGVVHVISVSLSHQVTSQCTSPRLGQDRNILGVAFNPASTKTTLYASTSILFNNAVKFFPRSRSWHNGEVIAFEKSGSCIRKTRTVISGLPVSDLDHGVNQIIFDNTGNMLVTVGSTSNQGVSKEDGSDLGTIPDSPFSGSMIIAPIMKPGFNGRIKYNQYNNPQTANKVSGDVSVYASGLRNSFGAVVHSNGNIYATSNGGNKAYGPRSTGCNSDGAARDEKDGLYLIKRGKWYGFANRNRGRFDRRQCVHRSPGESGPGLEKSLVTFTPSTNGLIEYMGNTFGAQLRGNLFASKFAERSSDEVFRILLHGDGGVKSSFPIAKHSGVALVMSATGAMYMPRVYADRVAVLSPIERDPKIMVVTSVLPFRGPKRGGGTVTITGWNLNPPLSVFVGGKACRNVRNFQGGRSLQCNVPPGSGKATVVVRKGSKASRSYAFEYIYMAI